MTGDTSQQDGFINATSGWPLSNAFPPQIYANGQLCPINWSLNGVGGQGQSNGWVPYQASDASVSVTLYWNWDGTNISWTWAITAGQWAGSTGPWDGASQFSGLPPGLSLTLELPSSPPINAPPVISWNGTILTYNGGSFAADSMAIYNGVRDGQSIRLAIDSAGNVAIYLGNAATPAFTGTYNSSQQLFDFGNANIGTINAQDGAGHNLGSTASSGNLAIPGNLLSLGTWSDVNGDSVGGLNLAFRPSHAVNQAAGVTFASAIALSDWRWSSSAVNGFGQQLTALQLDADNRLSIYAPGGSTPKIILDPQKGGSFRVPIRINASGDLPMNASPSGPSPGL